MLSSHINAFFFAITDFSSTECEQIKAKRDNLRRTYSKWSRKPRKKKCISRQRENEDRQGIESIVTSTVLHSQFCLIKDTYATIKQWNWNYKQVHKECNLLLKNMH